MPFRLRPLLLRLLLLTVCFHAAIGAALHEGRHLESLAQLAVQSQAQAQEQVQAQAQADVDARGETAPEEAHGLCAWCTAFAAQIAHAGPPPGLPPAAQTGRLRPAAQADGFIARPLRWVFAARDPPAPPG